VVYIYIYIYMAGLLTNKQTQSSISRETVRNIPRANENFELPSDKGKTFLQQQLEQAEDACEDSENEEGCKRKVLIIARELFNHFGFHGVAAKIGAIKDDLDEEEKKDKLDGGKTRHRKARNRKRTIKKKKRMKK
jgi:hypothetical protein